METSNSPCGGCRAPTSVAFTEPAGARDGGEGFSGVFAGLAQRRTRRAGFVSKKELRGRFEPAVADPKQQKAPAAPGSQRRALNKSVCPVADVEVLKS